MFVKTLIPSDFVLVCLHTWYVGGLVTSELDKLQLVVCCEMFKQVP